MADTPLITGFFKTRTGAEAAVDALLKRGYRKEDISVLMSNETRTKEFGIAPATKAATGASVGGALGGTVGAVLAAMAAVGTSIALPGLGLVIAGPAAAALAGLGAGAATGGLVGALIGAGIPEHRAKVYEAGLRGGGILVGVQARDDREADDIEHLLEDVGAKNVRTA
jgi:hypothetical protein